MQEEGNDFCIDKKINGNRCGFIQSIKLITVDSSSNF